jgi:hypothetical protein
VAAAGVAALVDVQGEGLFERLWERHDAVFAAFAVLDADPAAVQVDVVEADGDELGDAGAGVEQGLDKHDVGAAAGVPDGVVPAADLGFCRDVGQRLGGVSYLDAEFGAEVTEDVFEVAVVGSLVSQGFGELAGLVSGRCPLRWAACLVRCRSAR